jgi:tetratricopeptide (TPR) repeat protein
MIKDSMMLPKPRGRLNPFLLAIMSLAILIGVIFHVVERSRKNQEALIHVEIGANAALANDMSTAEKEYEKALFIDSGCALAFYNRAILHTHKQEYLAAVADFGRCIELEPKNSVAFDGRAGAFVSMEQYDQALNDVFKSVQLDSTNERAYLLRGIVWIHKNMPDRAFVDFNETLRLSPDNVVAITNRGIAYLQLGKLEQAETDAMRVIKLNDKDHYCHAILGSVLLERGDLSKAIAEYTLGIANGDTGGVFVDRGYARYLDRDMSGAKADYERALECDDSKYYAHMQRGRIFQQMGNEQSAFIEFMTVIAETPKNTNLRANRAYALAAVKTFDAAITECEQALSERPWDRWMSFTFSCIYCLRAKSHAGDDAGKRARKADIELAIKHLNDACKKGLASWPMLKAEPDLAILRGNPEFDEIPVAIRVDAMK